MDRTRLTLFGKLPFCALLPDSLDHQLNSLDPIAGEEIPPHMIRLIENFKSREIHAALFLRKQTGQPGLPYEAILPIEDLFGEWAYSIFALVVPTPYSNELLDVLPPDLDTQAWMDEVTDFGTAMLQKFAKSYRYVTGKHWISLPLKSRMSPWRVTVDFPGTQEKPWESQIDYRGTGQMIGGGVTLQQIGEIEQCCCSPLAFQHPFEFMEMANRFKTTGDYQAAILYLAIHSESWVYAEVRLHFKRQGKTDADIDTFFLRPDGLTKSITRVLKDLLGNAEFSKFEKTSAYIDWRQYVADRRNAIAHGTSLAVTQSQVQNGVNAVIEFRDYLLKHYLS